jgi:hypothetical protein
MRVLQSPKRAGLLAAAALISTTLAGIPASAQSKGITYPKAGVVCDQVGQVCYDSYGPSIGITKIYFGQFAADRLTANLRGASSNNFRLSSGQACSIQKRTCWDDGWSEKNVARGLTKQLFGTSNNNNSRQVSTDDGQCKLKQGTKTLYEGSCDLKQVSQGERNRFVITLGNGNKYVFRSSDGNNYTISDSFGGSWPVRFEDHGPKGVFRFADYKLIATQSGNTNEPTNSNEALGAAVNNLLNNLFK